MHENRHATATMRVDDDGRGYIPAEARRALGIHGETARVSLDIELLEIIDDGESDGDTE